MAVPGRGLVFPLERRDPITAGKFRPDRSTDRIGRVDEPTSHLYRNICASIFAPRRDGIAGSATTSSSLMPRRVMLARKASPGLGRFAHSGIFPVAATHLSTSF